MNLNGSRSGDQSSRRASTTSRCASSRIGLPAPLPRRRATRFFFRSFAPITFTSAVRNPAEIRRRATLSAAGVDPTPDSVDLISTSSWKISRASCWYGWEDCAYVWAYARNAKDTTLATAQGEAFHIHQVCEIGNGL